MEGGWKVEGDAIGKRGGRFCCFYCCVCFCVLCVVCRKRKRER